MKRSIAAGWVVPVFLMLMVAITTVFAQDPKGGSTARSQRRVVIYVMPNALEGPAHGGSQVIAESSHNGQEPQVAKIYHELQQSKSCQNFSENMIKERLITSCCCSTAADGETAGQTPTRKAT
jgi:hypothetical protein